MIHQAFLTLALALAAPAAPTATPSCCETVSKVVYEHPKPAYPKDVRQHTYVKRTVEKTACKADAQAACCAVAKNS